MTSLGAGKEVLSLCTKCKLTLAHIIVSMKDHQTVGKVICNTCKTTHTHKDPSSSKKKTSISTLTRKRQNETERKSSLWENANKDHVTKHHPYSIKTQFHLGDIIDHPKFGTGVVDRIFDSNKMEVVFQQEMKILIHNV